MRTLDRFAAALADRYRIERELGAGGMMGRFESGRAVVYIQIPGTWISKQELDWNMAMRKTSVEIDDDLVEQARTILGTHTLKDTIEGALLQVLRHRARQAEVAALRTMDGMELADADVMAEAWRP